MMSLNKYTIILYTNPVHTENRMHTIYTVHTLYAFSIIYTLNRISVRSFGCSRPLEPEDPDKGGVLWHGSGRGGAVDPEGAL